MSTTSAHSTRLHDAHSEVMGARFTHSMRPTGKICSTCFPRQFDSNMWWSRAHKMVVSMKIDLRLVVVSSGKKSLASRMKN